MDYYSPIENNEILQLTFFNINFVSYNLTTFLLILGIIFCWLRLST